MVTRSEQRRQALLLCYRLVLLAGCSFYWVSLLTFDPADWPSPKVWPHPSPPINLCGSAGACLAYQSFHWFGPGSYVIVLFATVAILAAILRGRVNDPWLRALGVALLVAGTATSVRMVSPDGADSMLHGTGGVVGIAIVHFLGQYCSTAGTALIVLCGIAIGLLLAAEGLAIKLPRAMGRLGHQAMAMAGTAGYVLVDRTGQAIATAAAKRETLKALPAPKTKPAPSTRRATAPAEPVADKPDRGLRLPGWLRMPRIDLGRLRRAKPQPDDAEPQDRPAQADADVRHIPAEPAERPEPIINRLRMPLSPAADDVAVAVEQAAPFTETERDDDQAPDTDEDGASAADEHPDGPDADDDPHVVPFTDEDADVPDDEDEDDDVEQDPDELKGSLAESPGKIVVRSSQTPTPAAEPSAVPYPRHLGDYTLPSLALLEDPEYGYIAQQESVVREKAKILERTLSEFRLDTRVVEIDTGPVITMYELELSPGIKVSQIIALSNDIARALKAPSVRVVAPIPGKNTIGIEVPNIDKENVRLKELLTISGYRPGKMELPLFLGKDASGRPLISDLAKMPHLLIAGTTGSGKSVCLNSIVMSILMTQRPDAVKLILVDPKMVEMSLFKDVPHLMCPIVTDMARAEMILDWATTKMDERYELLAEAGVRNIAAYNRLTREELDELFQPTSDEERAKIPYPLPHIIIIIDELADLMMTSAKEVEHHLSRLAQKSRAVGLHIIVATQRPEAKVVTGLIKSNLPCRIAFRVASRMDSRIVLDQNGGEVLMGQGDMLFLPPGTSKLIRAQGAFVSDEELKGAIKFLAEQTDPEFHPELVKLGTNGGTSTGERDSLFDEAARIIIESGRGSVSLLQRRLTVGYGRASRLVDQMAEAGIVGPYKGSQAREVLITLEEWDAIAERAASSPRQSTDYDYDPVTDEISDEE